MVPKRPAKLGYNVRLRLRDREPLFLDIVILQATRSGGFYRYHA